jgi:hypothetical protein
MFISTYWALTFAMSSYHKHIAHTALITLGEHLTYNGQVDIYIYIYIYKYKYEQLLVLPPALHCPVILFVF